MDKKNYLRPNMEVVEVSFQLPLAESSTSGDGRSDDSCSLNSFEDED